MDNIFLPISLGEAIDKLTILHIKVDKIKDNEFVKKEYDLLYEKLKEYFNEFYISLKKINLIIWDQMDILRDGNLNDNDYFKLCKECIECNDIRFRIKNKINYNSVLKEQKSYKTTKLLLVINCEINCDVSNNFNNFSNYVKYNSFLFDEVYINCKSSLQEFFKYDKCIKFEEINDFNEKIIINDFSFIYKYNLT